MVVEDGSGSGRSVGAGEECLQAERTAHPVCAGRGHRLPAGLLPQRQAALGAGQLNADRDPRTLLHLMPFLPAFSQCGPVSPSTPRWIQTQ